jgi:hypothetical protein
LLPCRGGGEGLEVAACRRAKPDLLSTANVSSNERRIVALPYQFTIAYTVPWRTGQEETSCVFHYDVAPAAQNTAGYTAIADALASEFKKLLGPSCTIVRERVNGPTDQGKAANVMEVVKDVSIAGTQSVGAEMASELAIVAWVYLGRGPNGGKQILRKYIHAYNVTGVGATTTMGKGVAALTSAQKTPITSVLDGLKNIVTVQGENAICNAMGKHLPSGSAWAVSDYAHTRQFKKGHKRKTVA